MLMWQLRELHEQMQASRVAILKPGFPKEREMESSVPGTEGGGEKIFLTIC